jgi:hypothetical protein
VCEAIGVQQLLRVLRTPGVARVQEKVVARAPPQAPLATELVGGTRHDYDDGEPRQCPFHPGFQHM